MAKNSGKNTEKTTSESTESIEEVILRIEKIQQQDLAARKRGLIVRYVIIAILLVWVMMTWISFRGIINILKSDEFIASLQQSSLNVGRDLIQKASDKAKETAPEIYAGLKDDIDAYVPVLFEKVKAEAQALTDSYIPSVVEQVNVGIEDIGTQTQEVINEVTMQVESQVQDIVMDGIDDAVAKLGLGNLEDLNPEQFQQLQEEIMKQMDSNVREIIQSELVESLNACVTQGEDAINTIKAAVNGNQDAGFEDLYIVTFKTFTEALKMYQDQKAEQQ